MAKHSLSAPRHEILRLLATQSELDENSDGYVTREEWIKGFL